MTYVKVSLHIRKTLLATTLKKKIAKFEKKEKKRRRRSAIMSFVIYIVAIQTLSLVRENHYLN